MGHYISIRGWLECPESQIQKVKGIITSFVEKAEACGLTKDGAEMYNKGWQIPDSHINWTYCMFYAADSRQVRRRFTDRFGASVGREDFMGSQE